MLLDGDVGTLQEQPENDQTSLGVSTGKLRLGFNPISNLSYDLCFRPPQIGNPGDDFLWNSSLDFSVESLVSIPLHYELEATGIL